MKKLITLLSLFAIVATPVFTLDAKCSGGSCGIKRKAAVKTLCGCARPCNPDSNDKSHDKCVKCHGCGGALNRR